MADSGRPLLTLPQGQVLGLMKETIYGDTYYSFEGIPYGRPPVGELRFRAPQPAEPWVGVVRDCSKVASLPVQRDYVTGEIHGDEDCLYLNIYAKNVNSKDPLPVMVWIYGGGFIVNGATPDIYGPDYFMRENVILVEFNYRLCALGFLSLCDPSQSVPGNAGLKDQVLALKWIKQNIIHFGGDPDNITVFGESAGGASVHFMLSTEHTRGLFHKAIVQSASILNYWANTPQAEMGYRLACQYGYKGRSVDASVLEFLQQLSPQKLVDHALLTDEERLSDRLFDFGPTVEPYESEDCVVPRTPLEMLRTAWGNEIPVMIGATSLEGIFMYPRLKLFPHLSEKIRKEPKYLLPVEIREKYDDAEQTKLAKLLVNAHFSSGKSDGTDVMQFMDYYSHSIFLHGIHRAVLSRLSNDANGPTYHYRFDFDSPSFNHYRTKFCGTDPMRGVAHADDLSYLFHQNISWKLEPDSEEYKTLRRMIGMWTAFARNSNPNCAEIEPAQFARLDKSNPFKALNIGAEIEEIDLPEKEKIIIWNSLYQTDDFLY